MNIKIEQTLANNPVAGFSVIDQITPTEGQILALIIPVRLRTEPVRRFVEHYNALVKVAEAAKAVNDKFQNLDDDAGANIGELDTALANLAAVRNEKQSPTS